MQFKYFEAFVSSKNKSIPCCNKINCDLCLGKYFVQIQKDDIDLMDRLIKNKLQSRMKEIQQTLRINTLDQFLDYHQHKYNYQLVYLYDNPTNGYCGNEINISLQYKNNGTIDWPNETYFKCVYPLEFKGLISQVTPLKSGSEEITEIKFKVPLIQKGEYQTKWKLCCKRNQEEIQFGPTIEIPCIVEESIEAANYLLFQKLKNMESWSESLDFEKGPSVLQANKDVELDINSLCILLLKQN